jgi:hypothetical protein
VAEDLVFKQRSRFKQRVAAVKAAKIASLPTPQGRSDTADECLKIVSQEYEVIEDGKVKKKHWKLYIAGISVEILPILPPKSIARSIQ